MPQPSPRSRNCCCRTRPVRNCWCHREAVREAGASCLSAESSMYLLDTKVIYDVSWPRPHGDAAGRLPAVADSDLQLSAVTLGEIQAGIELTRDQYAAKAEEIERWADLVSASYNVLPMDAETFRVWARLMHRRSDTLYEDAMIAATAKRHQLTVVTRNVTDFSHFDVGLLNPFEPNLN